MKKHIYINWKWILPLFLLLSAGPVLAQNDKEKEVAQMVEKGEFVFKAQTASPMRGRTVQLTSEYDMLVSADSIRTFLPYFGRAYMAQPYSGEGGIKITTTDFDYNVADKNKKRWNVRIEPADKKEVQQLLLSISKNGYASLQVVSTNRDPITFNGYIVSRN